MDVVVGVGGGGCRKVDCVWMWWWGEGGGGGGQQESCLSRRWGQQGDVARLTARTPVGGTGGGAGAGRV